MLLDTPALQACVLRYQHQGLQGFPSLTEPRALVHQRNLLFHGGTAAEELAHFIERSAET